MTEEMEVVCYNSTTECMEVVEDERVDCPKTEFRTAGLEVANTNTDPVRSSVEEETLKASTSAFLSLFNPRVATEQREAKRPSDEEFSNIRERKQRINNSEHSASNFKGSDLSGHSETPMPVKGNRMRRWNATHTVTPYSYPQYSQSNEKSIVTMILDAAKQNSVRMQNKERALLKSQQAAVDAAGIFANTESRSCTSTSSMEENKKYIMRQRMETRKVFEDCSDYIGQQASKELSAGQVKLASMPETDKTSGSERDTEIFTQLSTQSHLKMDTLNETFDPLSSSEQFINRGDANTSPAHKAAEVSDLKDSQVYVSYKAKDNKNALSDVDPAAPELKNLETALSPNKCLTMICESAVSAGKVEELHSKSEPASMGKNCNEIGTDARPNEVTQVDAENCTKPKPFNSMWPEPRAFEKGDDILQNTQLQYKQSHSISEVVTQTEMEISELPEEKGNRPDLNLAVQFEVMTSTETQGCAEKNSLIAFNEMKETVYRNENEAVLSEQVGSVKCDANTDSAIDNKMEENPSVCNGIEVHKVSPEFFDKSIDLMPCAKINEEMVSESQELAEDSKIMFSTKIQGKQLGLKNEVTTHHEMEKPESSGENQPYKEKVTDDVDLKCSDVEKVQSELSCEPMSQSQMDTECHPLVTETNATSNKLLLSTKMPETETYCDIEPQLHKQVELENEDNFKLNPCFELSVNLASNNQVPANNEIDTEDKTDFADCIFYTIVEELVKVLVGQLLPQQDDMENHEEGSELASLGEAKKQQFKRNNDSNSDSCNMTLSFKENETDRIKPTLSRKRGKIDRYTKIDPVLHMGNRNEIMNNENSGKFTPCNEVENRQRNLTEGYLVNAEKETCSNPGMFMGAQAVANTRVNIIDSISSLPSSTETGNTSGDIDKSILADTKVSLTELPTHIPVEIETCNHGTNAETKTSSFYNTESIDANEMEEARSTRSTNALSSSTEDLQNKEQSSAESFPHCEMRDSKDHDIKSSPCIQIETECSNEEVSDNMKPISAMDIQAQKQNDETTSISSPRMNEQCNESDSIANSKQRANSCNDNTERTLIATEKESPIEVSTAEEMALGENYVSADNVPDLERTKSCNADKVVAKIVAEGIRSSDCTELNTSLSVEVEERVDRLALPVLNQTLTEFNCKTESNAQTNMEIEELNKTEVVFDTDVEEKSNVHNESTDMDNAEKINNSKSISTPQNGSENIQGTAESTSKIEEIALVCDKDAETEDLVEEESKSNYDTFKVIHSPFVEVDSITNDGSTLGATGVTENDKGSVDTLRGKFSDDAEVKPSHHTQENIKPCDNSECKMDMATISKSDKTEVIAQVPFVFGIHTKLLTEESKYDQSVCHTHTVTEELCNDESSVLVHSGTEKCVDNSEMMVLENSDGIEPKPQKYTDLAKDKTSICLSSRTEMAAEDDSGVSASLNPMEVADTQCGDSTDVIDLQAVESILHLHAISTDSTGNNPIEICHSQYAKGETDTVPTELSVCSENLRLTESFHTDKEVSEEIVGKYISVAEMRTENCTEQREEVSCVEMEVDNNKDLATERDLALSDPHHGTKLSIDVKNDEDNHTAVSDHVEMESVPCSDTEKVDIDEMKVKYCLVRGASVAPVCKTVECNNENMDSKCTEGGPKEVKNNDESLIDISKTCDEIDVRDHEVEKSAINKNNDNGDLITNVVESAEVCTSSTESAKPISDDVVVDKCYQSELNSHAEVTLKKSTNCEIILPKEVECNAAVSKAFTETVNELCHSGLSVQAEPILNVQAEPVLNAQAEPVLNLQAEPVLNVQAEPVLNVQAEPVLNVQAEPVLNIQAEPENETCNKSFNSSPVELVEAENNDLASMSSEQSNIENNNEESRHHDKPAEENLQPQDGSSLTWMENARACDDENTTCSAIITNVRSIADDDMCIEIEENAGDGECQVVSIKCEPLENDPTQGTELTIVESAASDEMQILGTHYQLLPAQPNSSNTNTQPYSRIGGGDYYSVNYGSSKDNDGAGFIGNQPFAYSKQQQYHHVFPSAPLRRHRSYSQGKIYPGLDKKPYGYTLIPHAYNSIPVPKPKRMCSIAEYLKIVKRLDGRVLASEGSQNKPKPQEPFPVALIKANSDYSTGYMFVRPSGSEYNSKKPLPPGCNEEWWTLCHVEDDGTYANIPTSPISQLPPDIGKPAPIILPTTKQSANTKQPANANAKFSKPKLPDVTTRTSQRSRASKRKSGNPTRNTKRVKSTGPIKIEVLDAPPIPQENQHSGSNDSSCSSWEASLLQSLTNLNDPKGGKGHSKHSKEHLSGGQILQSAEEKSKKCKKDHKIIIDPEHREIARQRNKVHQQKLRQDPYYRQMERERNRLYLQKLRSDPQYRQKERERNRLYREKLRQRRVDRGSDKSQKMMQSSKENATDSSKDSESQ